MRANLGAEEGRAVTRIALVSDIHADVDALRDALMQIERLGCDLVVCAGDLVDCGAFAEELIALLRERRIPTIRGNHDRWACGRGSASDPSAPGRGPPRDASGLDLSPEGLRFLAELPAEWDATFDDVRVAVRHGTPGSDMKGIYPDRAEAVHIRRWLVEAEADVLVVGHTHVPFSVSGPEGGLVVNPGALLRDPAVPLDGVPWIFDEAAGTFAPSPGYAGGTFGVLHLPEVHFTVHRAADGEEVEIIRRDLRAENARKSENR